jgi:lactoylglutathione lyase
VTTGGSVRPFRVLGVQQIAIGALHKQPLLELWCGLLGLQPSAEYESASENVSEAILALGVGPTRVELDLMQPLDPQAKPKVHEPALNHIGLWVDDLHAAHRWLSAQGVRFTPGGIRKGAAGHDVCFVHPKPSHEAPRSGEGVLIELVQAPPAVVAAFAALAT